MSRPCIIAPEVRFAAPPPAGLQQFSRRRLLKRAGLSAAALT